MEQEKILKYNNKELFNYDILHRYDEDGQKGFLGYLLRYKQWEIKDDNIIFPDIKTRQQIPNIIREYDNDKRIEVIKIRQEVIRTAKYFGVEFCERQEKNRLIRCENRKKELEERKKRTKEKER